VVLHQRTLIDSYGEDSQNHFLDLEPHFIDEKKSLPSVLIGSN